MCLGADLSRLHGRGRRQFCVLNLSGDDLGASGLSQPRSVPRAWRFSMNSCKIRD